MPTNLVLSKWLRRAAVAALGLLTISCATPARTAAVAAPPIPPGQARIWFYRLWEPSISVNVANVALNGAPAGSVPAYGPGLYRDVPPGRYQISVQSYSAVRDQSKAVDVAPGQVVFVKIQVDNDESASGDLNSFRRDNFYVQFVPAELARAEIASGPG